MKKDESIYFGHILECISNIEKSIKGLTKEDFNKSIDIRDAVIRRIEIIGEAVKNLSDKTRKKKPNIEWKKIAGTRDVLIHAYFSVDIDLIWDIAKRDLPKLKKQIEGMLNEA